MISKASQRGGGQQLATHLMNAFDNELVEVADVRGAVAQDLHGALAEWRAVAGLTKCRKYLYSLSINPDPRQGTITRDQYDDFISRVEKKIGLEKQARAVVFHTKQGRAHCHVVWSRIDIEAIKAVQISHDRLKLRSVARDFARDYGLTLPEDRRKESNRERFSKAAAANYGEKQQEERTGITEQERMAAVTEAWQETSTAREFIGALEARGYYLTRGDRRAHVVVDRYGEVYSLYRQIESVSTAKIKARLTEFPLERLPDIERAQAFARSKREAARVQQPQPARDVQERSMALRRIQAERRAAFHDSERTLRERHANEQQALREAQAAESLGIITERARSRPRGLMAFLSRITGVQAITAFRQRRQDDRRQLDYVRQGEALQRRHARETRDIERQYAALLQVEQREQRSLRTAVERENRRLERTQRTLAPRQDFQRAAQQEAEKTGISAALEQALRGRKPRRTKDAERERDDPGSPGPSRDREPG